MVPIRVLLIDDQQLIRAGVRRILGECREIEVVGEAATGEEGLAQARRLRCDVVLMDIHMPGIGGLEATRRLKTLNPPPAVIALSVSGQEPYPSHLFAAGAEGYLSKDCASDEVVEAVLAVRSGKRYISRDVAQDYALSHAVAAPAGASTLSLSCRETEILTLTCQGRNTKDIGNLLHISPATVRTYRHRIYGKLGVRTSVELLREAWNHGLIPDEPGTEPPLAR
jgi:two-component system invasion response regulator UvrY